MTSLYNTLPQFQRAVESNQQISCNPKTGNWNASGLLAFKPITIWRNERSLIHTFCNALDKLESTPLLLQDGKLAPNQPFNYQAYLDTAKAIQKRILKGNFVKNFVKKELIMLDERILGLQNRLSGPTASVDPVLFENLKTAGAKWKQENPLILEKELTKEQLEQLKQAARYPSFTQALLKKPDFFKAILRESMPVDLLAQFPLTTKFILKSYIDKRITRLGSEGLKITLVPCENNPLLQKKIVTLRIQDKDENILDPHRVVTFDHNYQLTIQKIFQIFAGKRFESGNLEYSGRGVINWNADRRAAWNEELKRYEGVDFSKDKWWEQLPHIETLTPAELEKRLGKPVAPGCIGLCAMGSRSAMTLYPLDAHGWMEAWIPNKEGNFDLYPFGKFIDVWPRTKLGEAKVFCSTNRAKVQFPDENIFRSDRQRGYKFFPLDQEKSEKFLGILRSELQKAEEGNLVFQFSGDNCAAWVQDVFDQLFGGADKSPRLYDQPLWNFELVGPLNFVFGNIRRFAPLGRRDGILNFVLRIFGGNKAIPVMENGKMVNRTLLSSKQIVNRMSINPTILVQNFVKEKTGVA